MSAKHCEVLVPPRKYNAENIVLEIRDWQTPASDYPLVKEGRAEIVRTKYKRGYYPMEGMDGYYMYRAIRPLAVTALTLDGNVVMVDDPLHWVGMQRLAWASEGRVLVIGLGLGLIVHALVRNDKVTKIDVVEIDSDVVNLMTRYLPDDTRITVHCADGISFEGEYDTVLVDILVKGHDDESVSVAGSNRPLNGSTISQILQVKYPTARLYQWGYRNEEWNPAYTWKGDWCGYEGL